jgi:hypothetical protein
MIHHVTNVPVLDFVKNFVGRIFVGSVGQKLGKVKGWLAVCEKFCNGAADTKHVHVRQEIASTEFLSVIREELGGG